MRAVGRYRQVTPLQFMRPLRPSLDPLQSVVDREFDGPVIAALEMQETVLARRAPVATVDRIAAEDVERAADILLAAPPHDQDELVGHALADQREEFPVQIGGPPFSVGCRKV